MRRRPMLRLILLTIAAVSLASTTTLAGNPAWKEPSWDDTHFSEGCTRQLASFCEALIRGSGRARRVETPGFSGWVHNQGHDPRPIIKQKCLRPEYASPQCRALLIQRGLAQ